MAAGSAMKGAEGKAGNWVTHVRHDRSLDVWSSRSKAGRAETAGGGLERRGRQQGAFGGIGHRDRTAAYTRFGHDGTGKHTSLRESFCVVRAFGRFPNPWPDGRPRIEPLRSTVILSVVQWRGRHPAWKDMRRQDGSPQPGWESRPGTRNQEAHCPLYGTVHTGLRHLNTSAPMRSTLFPESGCTPRGRAWLSVPWLSASYTVHTVPETGDLLLNAVAPARPWDGRRRRRPSQR